MSALSRNKGATGERWAADLLALAHGLHDAERRCSGEESQSEQGRDLKGTPGYCVQVKNVATPSPMRAIAEAEAVCPPYEIPVALVRQSMRGHSTPFRFVFAAEDALFLIELERRFKECFPARHAELREDLHARAEALRGRLPHAL